MLKPLESALLNYCFLTALNIQELPKSKNKPQKQAWYISNI